MENVVPGVLQRLRATDVIHMAGLATASLGQEYYRIGAVHSTQRQGLRIAGVVDVPHVSHKTAFATNTVIVEPSSNSPSQITSYPVDLEIQSVTQWENRCPCGQHPPLVPTICPHAAALLYQWLARPMVFVTDMQPLEIPLHVGKEGDLPQTDDILPQPIRSTGVRKLKFSQNGPAPLGSLSDMLVLLGLSELRNIAREYDIAINGLSKQQLTEAILSALQHPDAVRKVAASLEKPQRQLLAALALAGGSITDDDLRGLFERFALGQPNQLQNVLLALQNKALLFRTSLNSASQNRIGLNGVLLDVGWYVPVEVRSALHVTAPVTPFDVKSVENEVAVIQEADPYALAATLLLVARTLDGTQINVDGVKEERFAQIRPAGTYTARSSTGDGSMALPPPSDEPAPTLVTAAHNGLSASPAQLSFAIRLLRLSDILHKDDKGTAHLRVLANTPQLLLGLSRNEVLRDLFELWLSHASYDDLFTLQDEGLRLRCRAASQNHPILRAGELEAENSEARQAIVALLTETPPDQWISFNAFARFVYRINPLFLQKRQQVYASPHWWIEQEEGHPLQPSKINDWLHAELHYIAHLLTGPLHWWGLCDVALSNKGRLLAFRLTPFAEWLLNGEIGELEDEEAVSGKPSPLADVMNVVNEQDVLVACSVATWPLIQTMEAFTEPAGTRQGRLYYHITPERISKAIGEGRQPQPLLDVLRDLEMQTEVSPSSSLAHLRQQLERWLATYGRVRIYTGVHMLETADAVVMRELSATTSLDEQIVQSISPTVHILKRSGTEAIIDDLKRRGQTLLLHDEE